MKRFLIVGYCFVVIFFSEIILSSTEEVVVVSKKIKSFSDWLDNSSYFSISKDDLLRVDPQHPKEIFQRVPGVWISRGSGQEHLTSIRSPVLTGPGACGSFLLLEDGIPVWMGCDVGKQMHRQRGLWDAELFSFKEMYGMEFGLEKADRLRYHQTMMTHAMLFTGVDVVDGEARRWRVENSWGDKKSGIKGFYTMNDSWFDEYMFEIAAPSSYLTDEMRAALSKEPHVLSPWDPMGSLARN